MAAAPWWQIPMIGVRTEPAGSIRLLERATVTLTKAGFRVAAVVHHPGDPGFDKPRSDSDRLRRAGATAVGLVAQEEIGLYAPRLSMTGTEWIAATLAGLPTPPDLMIRDDSWETGPTRDQIATIADGRATAGAPVLGVDGTERLLGLVCRRVRPAPRGRASSGQPLPAVAIVGHKNSGKTTLAERLVVAFSEAGLEVAAIKHASDERGFDKPQADVDVLAAAGAVAVGVVTNAEAGLYAGRETGGSAAWVETALAAAPLAPDLILYEGCRGGRHPKIECIRDPSVVAPTTPVAAGLLAVVSNHAIITRVPVFDGEAVEPIARLIRQALRLPVPGIV
jgi:molybdopterin-guanine dinucleotide biosynthesis adapter protein